MIILSLCHLSCIIYIRLRTVHENPFDITRNQMILFTNLKNTPNIMKATTETHEERFKDALMCYISEFDADFSSVFTYYFHSAAITAAESV